jgi:hypothetical protein
MDMDIPLKKGGSKEELIEQSLPGTDFRVGFNRHKR